MAGDKPDYIQKGVYVLFKGKPVRIFDFYFTSGRLPHVPNSDCLVVEFIKERPVDFDGKIKPITKGQRPNFIKVGKSVLFARDGKKKSPREIKYLYYTPKTEKAALNPTEKDLYVEIEGYAPMLYNKGLFSPAP
jgi:hypothetical protein